MTTDDDRIAHLEGEERAGLDPAERDALDRTRRLLADARLWDAPDPALEDRILAEIGAAAPIPTPARARRRPMALAAAAAVVVLLAGTFAIVRSTRAKPPAGTRFAVALVGTPAAPDAVGNASLAKTTSGWRIELHARGLPRRDGGRFYEAWLKNAAGVLVPVGTFNGGANVTLWAGVSPVDFPTLTVTTEVDDGNQASSGNRVLVGSASPR